MTITIKYGYSNFESGFLEKRCMSPPLLVPLPLVSPPPLSLFLGKLAHSRYTPLVQPFKIRFLTMVVFILVDIPHVEPYVVCFRIF